MLKFENIMKSFYELPTLPTVYTSLSDIMANPRSSVRDAAEVISKDQSAAAKILRAANSSIYGIRGNIDTVTQAISFIGFEEVKNLVFALSVINLFLEKKKSPWINPINLWKHSIAVGVISRLLGKVSGVSRLEKYFLAGILHDIGKLFLLKFFPNEYTDVLQYAAEEKIPVVRSEIKNLGITHNVVGQMIAEKWRLPVSLAEVISKHQTGAVQSEYSNIIASVHIADIAAYMFGYGFSVDDYVIPKPNPQAWDILDLDDNTFTSIINTVEQNYQDSLHILLINHIDVEANA